jgi:1-acyl-sn-glycerol-3-phosphate acyltransferase
MWRLLDHVLRPYDIDRIDQRDPEYVDLLYRTFHGPFERYFRSEVRGVDRIPAGPALYVGNHNALIMTWDSFLFAFAVYRERGLADLPYGLGHEVAIDLPVLRQIIVPAGAVRANHDLAKRLFAAGHKVMVYPGSEYDAMRSWKDRDRVLFGERKGFVRLALSANVPVVPVVAAGSQETLLVLSDGERLARWLRLDRLIRVKRWPISLALPWGLMLLPGPFFPWPSRILIEVLPPIRFDRSGPEAAADETYVSACQARVVEAMQDALTRLAAERRQGPRPGRTTTPTAG